MTDHKMDKKMEKKRFLIYIGITFGITWIYFLFTQVILFKGAKWGEMPSAREGFICLGMFCPAIGAMLTRLVTGEGFALTGKGSMMLGISFKDKKWIWFLVAILLPWIYDELGLLSYLIICPEAFDKSGIYEAVDDVRIAYIYPLAATMSGIIYSIAAYGEEAGWRGYMMPKLINIMGVKKAVIVGGIIWGVWHWPLTIYGHNFGTDYPGYPYVGMIEMCILATATGCMLTLVTVKTGSIWPAAIMHAVNNSSPGITNLFVNIEKVSGFKGQATFGFMMRFVVVFLLGAAAYMMLKKEEK